MEYCSQREAIIDWMVDWCWTIDPRNPAIGLPAELPFVPFPKQIEFIEWVYNHYLNQQNGLIEKSRDMGATWLFCAIFLREWRWQEGFTAGVGSRKLELVDCKDNPKAIFHKLRFLIERHPQWWRPRGFNTKVHDKIANLTNPEMHSNISGEGGDDIGRGDRRSMYLVDEYAFLEHQKATASALSQTTNSCFKLSTPNGMNDYAQERYSQKVDVFTFDWRDDPRKGQEWYEEQKRILDDVIVAQEIDHDYNASVENIFIPPNHVRAAVGLDLTDQGMRSAGLDVAAGGRNKSSLVIKTGSLIKKYTWNFKNGVDLTHRTIEVCNQEGVDHLSYDPIGVGHSVHSTIERTTVRMDFDYFPVGAGESPSNTYYEEFGRYAKDVFANAKTEWWYRVSVLFRNTYEFVEHGIPRQQSEMISIPNDPELMAQLSSPLKLYKANGKMMIEPKSQMNDRGIQSGDEADALVMSTIPKNLGFNRVFATYTKANCRPVNIDFENIDAGQSQIICVLWYDKKSGGIHGNYFFWGRRSKTLRIYAEIDHYSPVVQLLNIELREKARVALIKAGNNMPYVSKYLCNEDMQSNGKNDWVYILRKNANIRIQTAPTYEEAAAIVIARYMFQTKQIICDSNCVITNQECRNWRMIDNKPEADAFFHCRAICIAVSILREQGDLKDDNAMPEPYSPRRAIVRDKIRNLTLSPESARIMTETRKGKGGKADEYAYLTK